MKNNIMTQEQINLLLKDISARLPYKICAQIPDEYGGYTSAIESIDIDGFVKDFEGTQIEIENIKPYLFPLSSITIEQEKELSKLGVSYCEYALHDDTRGLGIMVDEAYIFFEFCYKHHIDFLGLIDMGLAIDATGKNIY
jgi:hypothetical protein